MAIDAEGVGTGQRVPRRGAGRERRGRGYRSPGDGRRRTGAKEPRQGTFLEPPQLPQGRVSFEEIATFRPAPGGPCAS
jgi:hypothetical protein